MHIKIGHCFELDTRAGLYIKVAGLGAAHRYPSGAWTVDRWATLRATGEVR
jgi:hypothetical protein